jgi:hypothetical protein
MLQEAASQMPTFRKRAQPPHSIMKFCALRESSREFRSRLARHKARALRSEGAGALDFAFWFR